MNLANSTLNLSALNLPVTATPQTDILIANDGSDAISGTFASILGQNGFAATVNYAYSGTDAAGRTGTGNDLAITIAIPEPASLGLLGAAGLC